MLNVIFERDSNECFPLFRSLEVAVSYQISVFFEAKWWKTSYVPDIIFPNAKSTLFFIDQKQIFICLLQKKSSQIDKIFHDFNSFDT